MGPIDPPSWTGAANARTLASAALRMSYRLRAHGAHEVGTIGPLVLVTGSEGMLAAAVIHATAPRPLHVLANAAMSAAIPERMLATAGDIPLSGPAAVLSQRRALAGLRDDRAVVVAGAGPWAAYLVAVSGAPVMPVVLMGEQGAVATDPPRPRSRIDVFYAPAVPIEVVGDPIAAATRAHVTERIRQLLVDAQEQASWRVVAP